MTLSWSEDLNITIDVEDNPFNQGVESCKRHVDAMTTSVVAAKGAQLASKAAASKKIGETVVQGFFSLIQNEIAQQMTELASAFPPKLQELRNFATRCVELRHQMEQDFRRIMERYTRLFDDLDHELALRIKTLDTPAFTLQQQSVDAVMDNARNVRVTVPIVSGSEVQTAQSQILSHSIRQRALAMTENSRERIASSLRLYEDLGAICDDVSTQTPQKIFTLVLFVEEDDIQGGGKRKRLLSSQAQPFASDMKSHEPDVMAQLESTSGWTPMPATAREHIGEYVSRYVLQRMADPADMKARREVAIIQSLWEKMSISSLQEVER